MPDLHSPSTEVGEAPFEAPQPPGLPRRRGPALWFSLLLLLLQPGSNLLYSGRWRLGWGLTAVYGALQVGSLVAIITWVPQSAGRLAVAVGFVLGGQALLVLIALIAGVAAHLAYRKRGYPRPFRRLSAGWATALALLLSTAQGLVVLRLTLNDTWMTIHTFTIPSGSMMPGYQVGDVIVAARPTAPFVRGQAMVFKPSAAPNAPYYIKRLIALPGDRIAVQGQRAIVNGQPETWQSRDAHHPGAIRACLDQQCYDLQIDRPGLSGSNTGAGMPERVLGPDEHFFLGDHRDQSLDRRYRQIGSQPARRIYYRAMLIAWPLNRLTRLDTLAD